MAANRRCVSVGTRDTGAELLMAVVFMLRIQTAFSAFMTAPYFLLPQIIQTQHPIRALEMNNKPPTWK
jgi:hypothetical protein